MKEIQCNKCGGSEFAEGTDFVAIRPLDKKLSMGSNKIYTFCLNCGEVYSIRIENPAKFRK
jgi:predicted nucleic-acid-binding Zn-ribbon protein